MLVDAMRFGDPRDQSIRGGEMRERAVGVTFVVEKRAELILKRGLVGELATREVSAVKASDGGITVAEAALDARRDEVESSILRPLRAFDHKRCGFSRTIGALEEMRQVIAGLDVVRAQVEGGAEALLRRLGFVIAAQDHAEFNVARGEASFVFVHGHGHQRKFRM
jgi:hypothetical protein